MGFRRGLRDWRVIATWGSVLLGAALFALLVVVVADGVHAREEAQAVARAEIARSLSEQHALTKRIDILEAQVELLDNQAGQAFQRIGALSAEVQALRGQLRALGVTPVVPSSTSLPVPSPTASPRPTRTPGTAMSRTPSAGQPRTQKSQSQPHPKPQPTPSGKTCLPLVHICL